MIVHKVHISSAQCFFMNPFKPNRIPICYQLVHIVFIFILLKKNKNSASNKPELGQSLRSMASDPVLNCLMMSHKSVAWLKKVK